MRPSAHLLDYRRLEVCAPLGVSMPFLEIEFPQPQVVVSRYERVYDMIQASE